MRKEVVLSIIILLIVVSCTSQINSKLDSMAKKTQNTQTATLAGGCFWCVEAAFEDLDGVSEVISGYAGGNKINPTYEEVISGNTRHKESIQITYNPDKISFKELIDFFWRQIDPTDSEGQFVDKGPQYQTAIFYHDENQKNIAQQSKNELEKSKRFDKPIVTKIIPFKNFYKAEEYHQDYSKKKTIQYKIYEKGSGRKKYREEMWGNEMTKPTESDLKKKLTPMQYKVTQKDGTEKPFDNEYWDNKKEGIYVDIVSGEPLFSSIDKFDSGTGWPSFTKPLEPDNIIEREDNKLFFKRIEVRSKKADSHLGHIFNDAPKELGGIRYCINSAALRFIPKEDLKKEGYGKYLDLFEN